jgi:hypothetical protein
LGSFWFENIPSGNPGNDWKKRNRCLHNRFERTSLPIELHKYYEGLPDFSCHNIPKWGKKYQTAMKYTKYVPNGHRILQPFPFPGLPKFTQMGIFALKTNHLAILLVRRLRLKQPFIKDCLSLM